MKKRPRRLRTSSTILSYVRENNVHSSDLIYPLFLIPGQNNIISVSSMPGIKKFTVDMILKEVSECVDLGIKAFILFGSPSSKDEYASKAYSEENCVQEAISLIKKIFPDVWLIADICVCSYTDHGHCGIVKDDHVQNDSTLEILSKMAVSCARAGADTVAPSAMMDGQVKAIREALDQEKFHDVSIMSYSAKFQSAFYGPFREAADSAPQSGDRASYQIDIANRNEAIIETALDIEEGADFTMVKPAMAFMDVISDIEREFNIPLVVYNVSGEYSMIKAAAEKGWINETKIVHELLTGFKRAGARLIITYFAKEFLAKSNST